jgi:predicted RNA methylase
MMYMAHTTFDDIEGKEVLDLGCGCGMLSIASILLGSSYNLGIDIDPDALSIFQNNVVDLFEDEASSVNLDLVNADVNRFASQWASGKSFLRAATTFDTVILNPPFGTKENPGIDMVFLQQALNMSSNAVYSMHKTSTRSFIERKAREQWGAGVQVLAQLKFDLPATYKFHKKDKVTIDVDLIRLEKKQ